ncbi:hypothetical protein G7Y79_00073g098220 [Physcia stellaris]|nr:hypothetical protein G7Y79_00073g098220 [Physcia stellaris]
MLSLLLLLLPLTLSSPLLPRQRDRVFFTSLEETCAEDPTGRLRSTNINPAALQPVTVQPLCDNVISTLCSLTTDASARYPSRGLKATATNPGTEAGACEAHLLFGALNPQPPVNWSYENCVATFQKITVECMLVGTGQHAYEGSQAGVLGVQYLASGEDSSYGNPKWRADNEGGAAGFMVGPPAWFGNVSVPDVSDQVPGYTPPVLG